MNVIPNKKMKEAREKLGLSQKQIAKKLNMPVSSYAMIEAGHRKNPHRIVQKKIADYYGYTIDELFFADIVHEMRPQDKRSIVI